MRKLTKAVSAILAVIMLIGVMMCAPFGVSAAETYGDFEYSLNDDNTCTITKYNGSASDLTIPSEIQGHKVSEIGSWAFFENCTSLTSVTIPDSVTSIGGSAFYRCTNLTSITIPSSVTSIGRLTFYNCTSLTSITIPDGVTSIEYEAFKNCTNLTSITIPDSVTNIGYEAFSGTIWEKNQPEGVIYAGKVAYSYKGNMPKNTEITLKTGTKSISYGAFEHCTNLTSISIPNGITSIGSGAFYNCTNLVSITISGSVTSIGDSAFEYCRSLKSITILGSVTSIGEDAFSGCKILTSVTIPNGVTSIGWGAFSGCKSLTSLTFLGSVTSIGTYAFSGCTNLTSITFPDSVTSIGEDAFSGCKSLTSVTIPNSVTSIGNYAFKNCTSLSSITIPDSVTSIAEQVFYGCKSLTSITIPSSVTSIGNRVFKDCTSLTSITIPDSVTYIGNEVFRGCTSLTNIKIPDSVTIIAEYAFYRCTNLTSITIPSSVTSIREDAFKNCTGLTIYGYENSYAQEYALNNDIPFVAIAGDYTFIKKHLEFIGDENANNTYHNQLKYFDVAKIALEDYGDLDNTYKLWKAVRGEIFENPYYTVLSDMVISESTAQGQLESFDIHLDSEFISVENDIIGLINSKVDLTPSQESKIKNMFKNRDFSDETTFKFCQDVLNNKVSKDELNSIFNAYDKTNTFLDVYNQGADIVESVYDTMNYSAILKAYENTSDEFKVVLMQMAYACQTENPWLYTAIEKYLNSDYDTEMRNKIVEEVAENGLNIGKALFKDSIESKVKTFLISNMDLSKVGTSVASGILAFVEGCKIGYAIGTGIDNLLFSTDDVSNSFVAASATAKTAGYLKYVLETNEANLRNNPILKNTVLFCETYNMYKNIQLNTADTMIKYFSKNQSALINQVFKGNNISYENEIYNWQILKLNWQNSSCHKGYILNSSIKNITVACPVNITVYNNAGEIVLEIADNAIKTDNGDVVATVCNNIKYVTLPDDSYNIKITATDDGTMSYSVCDLNVLENTSKTTCFENIKINKNSEYSGKVVSGSEYKQDDIALCNNNQKVSCKVSSYTNKNKVAVSNIKLSSSSLSLLIGEQHTISAGVAPQNASNKSVTWYSENPEIAKVDEYGNVTAVSSGKTKIVCVSLEDNIKSECDVEVKCPFGDVNGDGEITIEDATLIQKAVAGIATFDADQKVLADVNGDGEVSVFDVTLIQKYIVGGYSNTGNVGKPANV